MKTQNLYLYHWLHSGEKITFKESDAQTPISMTIQGLTSTGYLMAGRSISHIHAHMSKYF